MKRMCPKCRAINPPVSEDSGGWHLVTQCKHQIGIKHYVFGLIARPIYCNSINEFDMEDNDWIYLDDENENINKEKEMKTIKCKDISKNKISFEGITDIVKIDTTRLQLIGSGKIIPLQYETEKKLDKVYKKLNKLLKEYIKKEREEYWKMECEYDD